MFLKAFDEVIAPAVERFAPTWLLISAGFDAHRDDPITELGLTAGDFAVLTARAMAHVPAGRTLAMLEGGYDLDALSTSTWAVLGVLAGSDLAAGEPVSNGGPGAAEVDVVARTVAESGTTSGHPGRGGRDNGEGVWRKTAHDQLSTTPRLRIGRYSDASSTNDIARTAH